MVRIKICGITNEHDALKATALGAWALGFIFYKKSPRYVGAYKARKIISLLPPFVTPVGVFVNQKEGAIKDIARFCGLRALQFHGEETPEFCQRFRDYKVIKAFRVGKDFDPLLPKQFSVAAYLFDTYEEGNYGGTGKPFPWKLIKQGKDYNVPLILSGGLTAENVRAAIEEVRPYAVDVNSGVEQAPGVKSERLLKEFISQVEITPSL
jgi:phosphoribosylanthranilate isomerase